MKTFMNILLITNAKTTATTTGPTAEMRGCPQPFWLEVDHVGYKEPSSMNQSFFLLSHQTIANGTHPDKKGRYRLQDTNSEQIRC